MIEPSALHSIDALTSDHLKVLYLISLYAVAAESAKQNERWIRQIPLFVLIFEAIVCGKLGFDYAPASIRLSYKGKSMRRWINISQEGKTAIEDLWDGQLVNGIKLSSDDFQPVSAYQVSSTGQKVLQTIPQSYRDEINGFIFPPPPNEPKVLQVSYDGNRFYMRSGSYTKSSSITESEDVSYVSSPFLPACLRSNGYYSAEESSNAHRSRECMTGISSLAKNIHEAITLGNVYALVGEWVPFGSNQIVALNERMGALDRCKGGILTSQIDIAPTDAYFRMPVGQTQVRILDFDLVRYINLEAESHFPESPGIVQVEHFGMHMNCDGCLVYGVKVEAIMQRQKDDIPMDYLSRLLVDVHQDSSVLVNDLLSRYQLSLLDMIFLGDSFQRNKYNCIMAKTIVPKLPANRYKLDKSLANELAQVLGDIISCHDITAQDIFILGRSGCLLVGPNNHLFQEEMTAYVGLVCRDLFCKNFFARTFVLDSRLKEIRQLIHYLQKEPNKVALVRQRLTMVSKDTILLAETLEYLLDSLENAEIGFTAKTIAKNLREMDGNGHSGMGGKIYTIIGLQRLKNQILMRCHDSVKLMENTMLQLEQLQTIAESMATSQLESASGGMNLSTVELMRGIQTQKRNQITLDLIQILIAGIFAFDVLDRIDGHDQDATSWARTHILVPLCSTPLLWILTLSLILLITFLVVWNVLIFIVSRTKEGYSVSFELYEKISVSKFKEFVITRDILDILSRYNCQSHEVRNDSRRFLLLRWKEHKHGTEAWDVWGDYEPELQVLVDEKHEILIFVWVRMSGISSAMSDTDCLSTFKNQMSACEVLRNMGLEQ